LKQFSQIASLLAAMSSTDKITEEKKAKYDANVKVNMVMGRYEWDCTTGKYTRMPERPLEQNIASQNVLHSH
jgi:hypothetical protein